MNIQEFRQKYPEYNDIPDRELADSFHQKYYSDIPKEKFDADFLGASSQITPQSFWKELAKSSVNQADIAGMMAGGAAGTFLGGQTIPGAALGGMAGTAFKQAVGPYVGLNQPHPLSMEASNERARAGAIGGISEAALPVLGVLGKESGAILSEAQQIQRLMREKGIQSSTSGITGGMGAKTAEEVAGSFLPAKLMMQSKMRRSTSQINEGVDNILREENRRTISSNIGQDEIPPILKEGGTAAEAGTIGGAAKTGTKQAIDNWWTKLKDSYKGFYSEAERQGIKEIDTGKFKESIVKLKENIEKNWLPGETTDKAIKELDGLYGNIGKNADAEQLHTWSKQIYNLKSIGVNEQKFLREGIMSSLGKASESGDVNLKNMLEGINKQYAQGHEKFLDLPLVRSLAKPEGIGSISEIQATSRAWQPQNLDALKAIKENMEPATWEAWRLRYLGNFFDPRSPIGKNIVKDLNETGSKKYIDGKALEQALNDHKKILSEFFDPGTITGLREWAKISKATLPDVEKLLKNQLPGDLARIAGTGAIAGGAIGAGALNHPFLTIGGGLAYGTGSMAIARSLMSPRGYLRILLTEGAAGAPLRSEALKMGGRAVFTSRMPWEKE
jgi:hypothetical protein